MEHQHNLLDRLVNTSVRFNGVMIPASRVHTALARYVDNLFVWNDHETYKLSLFGSAVPIKYAGHYFLLCTNHQLQSSQLENVSLLSNDGQKTVTSAGVRQFSDESHPGYLDLAAFEFTEPCEEHPEFKERFFELRESPPDAPNTDVIFAVVAGFPCQDQKYELEEKNHIGRVKRIVICQVDPSAYDPALLCLRTTEPLDFNPDGMSGGSAFVVQIVNGEFRAYFAGIVVTGGNDRFHIIKGGLIRRFLNTLVKTARRPE